MLEAPCLSPAVQLPVTNHEGQPAAIILVADDVEETRDAIDRLLTADGYRVHSARGEHDAVERAGRQRPDLILVSLGGPTDERIATAERIRGRAELGALVPVVVFCVPTVDEGAEVAMGRNVYVTRPDNFDQLRAFLGRLLSGRARSG
jgi:CheY-like chemotaxis protein